MKICGLDECGRGAFAGPLVAAAAVIHCDLASFPSLLSVPLRDSKKLTELQRNQIVSRLKELPITYAIEEISASDINSFGLGWANKEIFERLIKKVKATLYIIDGNLRFSNPRIQTLIKGDNKCYPVMLASIIAKVHRDNLLKKYHQDFPLYGWDQNSGYGTGRHLSAIKNFGSSPLHRIKFVQTYLGHAAVVDTQFSK